MEFWQFDLPGVEGQFDQSLNFGVGVVDRHSVVMVSACELSQPQGEPLDYPFQGNAIFTIHNVVPGDDGTVQVTIDTGWSDFPINIRLNVAISPIL